MWWQTVFVSVSHKDSPVHRQRLCHIVHTPSTPFTSTTSALILLSFNRDRYHSPSLTPLCFCFLIILTVAALDLVLLSFDLGRFLFFYASLLPFFIIVRVVTLDLVPLSFNLGWHPYPLSMRRPFLIYHALLKNPN